MSNIKFTQVNSLPVQSEKGCVYFVSDGTLHLGKSDGAYLELSTNIKKHEHEIAEILGLETRLTNDENAILHLQELINSHKNDVTIHVTSTEKETWNNKADNTTVTELEDKFDSTILDIADAVFEGELPEKDLLVKLDTIDFENEKWIDSSGNNLHADFSKSNALFLDRTGYVKAQASGVGDGDFYYEVIYQNTGTTDGASRIFSDGGSNAGGKKFEIFYFGTGEIHYGIRDGTNYESGLLFSGLTEYSYDRLHIKIKRTNGVITATCHNLINDIVIESVPIANSYDFKSEQIFSLNRGYTHNSDVSQWMGDVIYCTFKCGVDENNIVYDFAFSEGAGNYIYNRVDGKPFPITNPQWVLGNSEHKNLLQGFTKEATYAKVLTPVHNGSPNTDAFCSITHLGDGICLAGKRSSITGNRIFRSTDYGENWSSVGEIAGYTGSHTYFFGHDGNGVVICGTGDNGNVCMMRSIDYGATWNIVLTTTQIRTMAGTSSDTGVMAVFSSFYMGNGRWICNLRNDQTKVYMIESLDNGLTWGVLANTGLNSSSRKMFRASNDTIIYPAFVQEKAIYISRDNGYTFQKKFTGDTQTSPFAGSCEIETGVYLVGTYGGDANPAKILKSTDDGETWTEVFSTTGVNSVQTYFREIIQPYRGLIIAYCCAGENDRNRGMKAYYSYDDGQTWVDKGNPYSGVNGGLNAIYQTAKVGGGIYIMATQPDSMILRSYLPNVKIPVSRTNSNKDIFDNPLSNLPSTTVHNGAETGIRFQLDSTITSNDTENLLWDGTKMKDVNYNQLTSTYKTGTKGVQLAVKQDGDVKTEIVVYKNPITNKFVQAGIDNYLQK